MKTSVMPIACLLYTSRALFKTSRDLEDLVRVIVGYGVVYCLFIAVELRLSPQMHSWVYGYVPHQDFLQVLRWGGYRPVVFMTHGLALALMMFHVTVLATALAKVKITVWKVLKPKTLAAGLFVVLILCKSTGAILFEMCIRDRILGPLKLASTVYWWVGLALGLWGLGLRIRALRFRVVFEPPLLFWAYFAAVHAVVVVMDRYHFPSVPFIAILAAQAIVWIRSRRAPSA